MVIRKVIHSMPDNIGTFVVYGKWEIIAFVMLTEDKSVFRYRFNVLTMNSNLSIWMIVVDGCVVVAVGVCCVIRVLRIVTMMVVTERIVASHTHIFLPEGCKLMLAK